MYEGYSGFDIARLVDEFEAGLRTPLVKQFYREHPEVTAISWADIEHERFVQTMRMSDKLQVIISYFLFVSEKRANTARSPCAP